METEHYLTSGEVADILNIKVATLRNSVSSGILLGYPAPPSVKFGRFRRYPKSALENWIKQHLSGVKRPSADVLPIGLNRHRRALSEFEGIFKTISHDAEVESYRDERDYDTYSFDLHTRLTKR